VTAQTVALMDVARVLPTDALQEEVARLEARLASLRREMGRRAHTPGPWRLGIARGTVVANSPIGTHADIRDAAYYGGYLICESVATDCNRHLIAAAPELLGAVQAFLSEAEEAARLSHAVGGRLTDGLWEQEDPEMFAIVQQARWAVEQARGGVA
jgi:hypothetical protein